MKKNLVIITALAACAIALPARACLTFCLQHEEDIVYGRNFDWNVDTGAAFVNQRNVQKMAFVLPPETPLSWISKYGSVTFNQFSREIPIGGMNEKGLVIESMVCSAQYPKTGETAAVNELQWIQYHLDTCETVDEAIASASKVRISPYAVRLHYLVTDSSGQTAAIEFIHGKMLHTPGNDMPAKVLANNYYEKDLLTLDSKKMTARSGKSSRFARAARSLEKYDGRQKPVDYAFQTLDSVAQGGLTKWQIVYDIKNMRIYFKTRRRHNLKLIELAQFDFAHAKEPLMLDVNTNAKGRVNNRFVTCTEKLNDNLIKISLIEFREAGIMQHVTPQHVKYIKEVVSSCKQRAEEGVTPPPTSPTKPEQ